MRIGVDTGGTFTDFVAIDDEGRVESFKLRSNPRDPASVILAGIERATAGRAAQVVHGSTVATNALLERKGARTAFVTTAGFEDIFHIGRQNRRELYNLTPIPRIPLVRRDCCFGIEERILFDGTVLRELTKDDLSGLRARIERAGVESIAICLLHSCQNPAHERAVAEALRGCGYLSISSDVSPEFREYERSSTTVLNAYVGPLIDRYLARLSAAMGKHELGILQSNGGTMTAGEAAAMPVRTLLSGPAGGAIGAAWIAKRSGFRQVIGFDMGGTSTDVCVIQDSPRETTEARVDGFPLQMPMLDIHTVGAGGGSIARVDEGGLLRVGPESAGAEPGPACYGSSELLTVTDAHVFLGRIAEDQLAGGSLRIDASRSAAAVEKLAAQLGMSANETAAGVIRVANANMERALRQVSVERGYDPRRFALLAFGGGGGLHACEIAESLEMSTVLVPSLAGALSALGMLVADRVRDYSQSVLTGASIPAAFRRLEQAAKHDTPRHQRSALELRRSGDLRYLGQSYELNVPWLDNGPDEGNGPAKTIQAFHKAHHRLYGYADPAGRVEVVAVRVRAVIPSGKMHMRQASRRATHGNGLTLRRMFVSGRWRQVPCLSRTEVGRSGRPGPLLVLDYGSTALVPPGWRAKTDPSGTLIVSR
jgi:N-methylhydantoinase A